MHKRSGFTLVEVMVVITITAMLSGLVLIYNSQTRSTLALFTEKVKVAQLILRAKSLSLSTYAEAEVPCGYGVVIDEATNAYSIFAYRLEDCSDLSAVDTSDDAIEEMETGSYVLPSNVTFGSGGATTGDNTTLQYVIFIPPDPKVLIATGDGALILGSEGEIQLNSGNYSATIVVNAAGQITF